jgi:hypothetical protein
MLHNMTRKFSIHKTDNAIFVTDNNWSEHKALPLPSPKYQTWIDVKEYFAKLGTSDEALSACRLELETKGDAILLVETL